GIVTFAARKLYKRTTRSWKQAGNAQFGQQFSLFKVGREVAFEEILRGNSTAAGVTANLKCCVQGQHHSGQFGGWISVGNTAADSAAVADGRMSNAVSSFCEQREACCYTGIALYRRIAGNCAQCQ